MQVNRWSRSGICREALSCAKPDLRRIVPSNFEDVACRALRGAHSSKKGLGWHSCYRTSGPRLPVSDVTLAGSVSVRVPVGTRSARAVLRLGRYPYKVVSGL
ncbi:hypothetical protein NDU88_002670 [Pleurodeles waltl]|uniref:Uncharacterized protein n=1 Tax=Pleurodeles waltl TaxID=8319 RepID=A0AAV7Q7D3_PLEWA|nr:hypothetical protein NDU88_002670 [Pleurodeles waltl]